MLRLCVTLMFLALGGAASAALPPPAEPPVSEKSILVLPTLQWDADGARWRDAFQQGDADIERVMGGLTFGMTPREANRVLPNPAATASFDDLPRATEFPEEVHYTWMHMAVAGKLIAPVKSCFGAASYLVVLFRPTGLFRVSWRFLPDRNCPDVWPAAAELYATFVPIATTVAFSVHYHTGFAQVVDVTDPRAGILLTERWLMPGQ